MTRVSRQEYAYWQRKTVSLLSLSVMYGFGRRQRSGWAGIAQRLGRRTRDRNVAGSSLAGAAGEFSSPGSTFCAGFYFAIPPPPPPRVSAVARKRSQLFCQKRRWQVTAKHTCTYFWGLEWRDTVNWCMVVWYTHNVGRDGTSHATIKSAVSTPLRWIKK